MSRRACARWYRSALRYSCDTRSPAIASSPSTSSRISRRNSRERRRWSRSAARTGSGRATSPTPLAADMRHHPMASGFRSLAPSLPWAVTPAAALGVFAPTRPRPRGPGACAIGPRSMVANRRGRAAVNGHPVPTATSASASARVAAAAWGGMATVRQLDPAAAPDPRLRRDLPPGKQPWPDDRPGSATMSQWPASVAPPVPTGSRLAVRPGLAARFRAAAGARPRTTCASGRASWWLGWSRTGRAMTTLVRCISG